MARKKDPYKLSSPQVYLWRMSLFVILCAFLLFIQFETVADSFMANPVLNGLIIAVGVFGIVLAVLMVMRLFREIAWVNRFRTGMPAGRRPPLLLAPMATLLRDGVDETVMSAVTMRAMLDTIGTRLDEKRDILRYLIGLLVFLGLLGTFYGLLQTVGSVGATIQSLDVSSGDSSLVFQNLKSGLEAPLVGMGTAFSSSLFGLTGSLIVGFLDLQAGQAQNRFYTELEDWLSTLTDIVDDVEASGVSQVALDLQRAVERLSEVLATAQGGGTDRQTAKALGSLAEGIQAIVKNTRREQKVLIDWAEAQGAQNERIEELLVRLNRALEADERA
ncbi:flagellar motor protein MotA [Acuticoccus sp. I52.16.1]|uniref:flagellar motor protein MotA n=1 Tax=Acuticoccus sp. I52.16.1 TaxID=2928472 RepID=UPI001FD218C1|nr:flagellar motor protein MotA [Acuticoccus sp. I52.16.1]UOM33743.1 flagellar motor protein MotA [Acuticoccus sp. I52.16.1]